MSNPTMRIWDISPAVDASSAVFPGDAPYQQHWTSTLEGGSVVNVSAITLSPHTGAHADAPLHYDPLGLAVGQLPLEDFIGPCRVVHALDCGALVQLVQLAHLQHAAGTAWPARVLVRTCSNAPPPRWTTTFAAFAPDTIAQLAAKGVRLIGIDTASIDPADSATLPSHQTVRRLGLRVLENLVLNDVAEGDYELIALPLKWTTADASPVRAVLRDLPR